MSSDESSSDEGQLQDSEDETGPGSASAGVAAKLSNRKLWANVIVDQTADDMSAGVNTYKGNRSVESVGYSRKRKFVEMEQEQEEGELGEDHACAIGDFSLDAPGMGAGGKRKRVQYGNVSVEPSEEEGECNVAKYSRAMNHVGSNGKVVAELDITFEDVIVESSKFLERAKSRSRQRPGNDSPKEAIVQYLQWILNEQNTQLLQRIVKFSEAKFLFNMLDQTIHTERQGGILTNSGIRRRLPGGVFINMVRKCTDKVRNNAIFLDMTLEQAGECAKRRMKKKRCAEKRKLKERMAVKKGAEEKQSNAEERCLDIAKAVLSSSNENSRDGESCGQSFDEILGMGSEEVKGENAEREVGLNNGMCGDVENEACEGMENGACEDMGTKACEDMGNKACEDMENKACEDMGNKACEDMGNKACEDMENKACEDMGNKACEDMENKACEDMESVDLFAIVGEEDADLLVDDASRDGPDEIEEGQLE